MRDHIRRWATRLKAKWYWILPLLLYKLVEDWGLGYATKFMETHTGRIAEVLSASIYILPFITWSLIPLVIVGLLASTWIKSKSSPIPTSHEKSQIISTPKPKPVRLEHDGVLWEDTGKRYVDSGNVAAEGPLCPKDYCPLGLRYGNGMEYARANEHYYQFISDYFSHAILFCHECKTKYTLGTKAKQLKQSREEVESRFEGLRKRNANT